VAKNAKNQQGSINQNMLKGSREINELVLFTRYY